MWSKKFEKCQSCGTNKKKHMAHGYCRDCYTREYRAQRKINPTPNGKWSLKYDACISCGTSLIRHGSRGYCVNCYARELHRWKMKKWSLKHDACIQCNSNLKRHIAHGYCKECYYHLKHLKNKTNIYIMIKSRYNDMVKRSRKKCCELCSFNEFKEFALKSEEFKRLRAEWIDSNFEYKLSPSVDRINNNRGYSIDNIQFLTTSNNVKKGRKEINQGKKVLLVKGDEVLLFDSQYEANKYLETHHNAVHQALKNNGRIQGWKPHKIK